MAPQLLTDGHAEISALTDTLPASAQADILKARGQISISTFGPQGWRFYPKQIEELRILAPRDWYRAASWLHGVVGAIGGGAVDDNQLPAWIHAATEG